MPIPPNLGNGNLAAPGSAIKFVTANDSTDLPFGICRGLLVGTGGAARIIDADGNDSGGSNLVPLQTGYNPLGVKRIYSTGLVASNIWAIY